MADDARPAAEPMLAIAGEGVPTGREWVHEVKWDGMRLLADVHDGAVRLLSRSGRDVTDTFPELRSLCRVADDVLLDGEVIALRDGAPSFAALADRMHVRDRGRAERLAATRPVTFMVFDVLRVAGTGVTHLPWTDRRRLLEALDLDGLHCQVPQVHDDGAALFEATRESGLEGVVSKRRSAPYLPGRRSGDWVKSAHRLTVSAVVGGWRPESNGSGRIGALLVGQPTLRHRLRLGVLAALDQRIARAQQVVTAANTASQRLAAQLQRVSSGYTQTGGGGGLGSVAGVGGEPVHRLGRECHEAALRQAHGGVCGRTDRIRDDPRRHAFGGDRRGHLARARLEAVRFTGFLCAAAARFTVTAFFGLVA